MTPCPSLRTPLAAAALLGAALAPAPAGAQEPPPPPPQEAPAPAALRPVRVLGPAEIAEWEEGDAVPYGYRRVKKIQKRLVLAGAITFGSAYLTSALGGAIATDAGAPAGAALFVPVFGPFVAAGLQGSATGGFLLVLDGLAQAAGVTVFALGMARPKVTLRRDLAARLELAPVPLSFGPGSGGLGLRGTF